MVKETCGISLKILEVQEIVTQHLFTVVCLWNYFQPRFRLSLERKRTGNG